MAEQHSVSSSAEKKEPQDSHTRLKKVLVCLGERRREVSFAAGNEKEDGGDVKALLDATGEVFADVLTSTSQGEREKLILQMKSEDWDGEFVDAEGEIPDKAVLRALRTGQFNIPAAGSLEEVKRHFFLV